MSKLSSIIPICIIISLFSASSFSEPGSSLVVKIFYEKGVDDDYKEEVKSHLNQYYGKFDLFSRHITTITRTDFKYQSYELKKTLDCFKGQVSKDSTNLKHLESVISKEAQTDIIQSIKELLKAKRKYKKSKKKVHLESYKRLRGLYDERISLAIWVCEKYKVKRRSNFLEYPILVILSESPSFRLKSKTNKKAGNPLELAKNIESVTNTTYVIKTDQKRSFDARDFQKHLRVSIVMRVPAKIFSKILVHEIGHWFGLAHVFEENEKVLNTKPTIKDCSVKFIKKVNGKTIAFDNDYILSGINDTSTLLDPFSVTIPSKEAVDLMKKASCWGSQINVVKGIDLEVSEFNFMSYSWVKGGIDFSKGLSQGQREVVIKMLRSWQENSN